MPYGQDLSARAVAKRFELSVSSLQHFFRRFANQSFHKYVEEVRMGKAFELISEGNKRIKEVMYATGYHNRHSFNRAFKDKYGYPPSTFKL